jgi:hypothetical protein
VVVRGVEFDGGLEGVDGEEMSWLCNYYWDWERERERGERDGDGDGDGDGDEAGMDMKE